jgi:hypothetical protein
MVESIGCLLLRFEREEQMLKSLSSDEFEEHGFVTCKNQMENHCNASTSHYINASEGETFIH